VSSLFDGVDPTHAPPQPRLPFAHDLNLRPAGGSVS
jgi:hypothetical protein